MEPSHGYGSYRNELTLNVEKRRLPDVQLEVLRALERGEIDVDEAAPDA